LNSDRNLKLNGEKAYKSDFIFFFILDVGPFWLPLTFHL
jgi:hypothetical protein